MSAHIASGNVKSLSQWKNIFKDIPCFLIGNGPSLFYQNTDLLENYFTIGINRAFPKIDPTVILWQDMALWSQEKNKVQKLQALKYVRFGAGGERDKKDYIFFQLKGKDSAMSGDPSILQGRGSSGPLAFQLGFMLGCSPIVLLGMDCAYEKDKNGVEKTDYYGKNPMHRSHTLPNCKRGLTFMKGYRNEVDIINCSTSSVLGEPISLEEALGKIDYEPMGREYYKEKLLSAIGK